MDQTSAQSSLHEVEVPFGLRGVSIAFRAVQNIPGLANAGDVICCAPPPNL